MIPFIIAGCFCIIKCCRRGVYGCGGWDSRQLYVPAAAVSGVFIDGSRLWERGIYPLDHYCEFNHKQVL